MEPEANLVPLQGGAATTDKLAGGFECLIHLDESLTFRVSCDRTALLRHLADRMVLRLLAPKQVRGFIRPQQAGWNAVVVEWTDDATGITGIHNIAVELVHTKVSADEQEAYRKMIDEFAEQQPLDVVTMNLLTGILNVAMRSLAIGAEVCFPTGDVSAARYDEAERIPMIGVVRRGRGGPNNAEVRPTRHESLELSRQYDPLKGKFKGVFRVHKTVASMRTWREILMKEYEWLPQDIIERLGDPDHALYSASNLAIELAARRSINQYEPFSVSANRLKKLRGK